MDSTQQTATQTITTAGAFADSCPLTPLDQLRHDVFKAVPPLKSIQTNNQTVRDYLAPMHQWIADSNVFPMATRGKEIIGEHVSFYFGDEAAQNTIAQLDRSTCIETGTHLSFPRDQDYANKNITVDNTMVWQGAILSAISYKAAGMKYHLASPTGIMSTNNTNGPLYIQLGRTNFLIPIFTGKKARNSTISFTDALGKTEIASLIDTVKQQIFTERMDELRQILPSIDLKDDDRIQEWTKYVNANKGYSDKNYGTAEYISSILSNEYNQALYDYAPDLERLDSITTLILQIVDKGETIGRPVSYADQAIVVQKFLMDEIMPEGIEHMTWDISQVSKQLMIEAFKDETSTFYKIFSNPELRDQFTEHLGNIGIGWTYNEHEKNAPFMSVRKSSKGLLRPEKIPYDKCRDHLTPEKIVHGLKNNEIIPVLGLDVIFTIAECGFMFHGGMFQCQYAPEYAQKMANILDNMGLNDRAESLRSIPLDIATQSLAFASINEQESTRLARYSDLLQTDPISTEQAELVLNMDAKDALTLAAPSLMCFLNNEEQADPDLQKQAICDVNSNGQALTISSGHVTTRRTRNHGLQIV